MTIAVGSAEPLGVEAVSGGLNVAVFSAHASAIEFCAFDETGTHEVARHTLPGRTGPVFHGFIPDLGVGTRYGLRAHGPWAPAQGHRFNPARLLLDPHARLIDRPFHLDPALFDAPERAPSDQDDAALVPKGIVTPPCRPCPKLAARRRSIGARRRSTSCMCAASPASIRISRPPCAAPSPASPTPPRLAT